MIQNTVYETVCSLMVASVVAELTYRSCPPSSLSIFLPASQPSYIAENSTICIASETLYINNCLVLTMLPSLHIARAPARTPILPTRMPDLVPPPRERIEQCEQYWDYPAQLPPRYVILPGANVQSVPGSFWPTAHHAF